MKYRTADLEGALLDAAVAKAAQVVIEPEWLDVSTIEDVSRGARRLVLGAPGRASAYSTDWQHGGPIIERERITLSIWPARGFTWAGLVWGWAKEQQGDTPLIAAMRAYVASKLGEEVEL